MTSVSSLSQRPECTELVSGVPVAWHQFSAETFGLAESPFWHPQEQTLYWIDIAGRQLVRSNVYMGTVQRWSMPCEPGCIAPAVGGGLVVALRDGIYRAPVWGGALHWLVRLPYDPVTVRANDGKCDALGRFWVGTVDETKSAGAGAWYCIDARHGAVQVQQMAAGVLTANGLAWSPQGDCLYWADTPRHAVRAWTYAVHENVLTEERSFAQFAPKPSGWDFKDARYAGRPDGAAVDAHGNYWVAMYEGRRLCKIAPDGTLLCTLPTPVQCPTMPCFGGEDFKTLYLTSARTGRSAAELADFPQSGGLFYTRVDTPGLPVKFFCDQFCEQS